MTHVASELDGAIRAISASSLLSRMTHSSANALPDGAKWLPNAISGHRVYNFEVETTHTYIADGIRVHNQSVIDFVPTDASSVDWESLADMDPDVPGFDYVETQHRDTNGNLVGTTAYKVEGANGQYVGKVYTTTTDANGRLVQIQYTVDQNKNIIGEPEIIPLTGAQRGEKLGEFLTPILTRAVIGEDASAFETIVGTTILGTLLTNTLEFSGGYLHDQIVSGGDQNKSLQAIYEETWGDLKVDASGLALSTSQTLLNNYIMAEIFGETFSDGVPGAAAEALTGFTINLGTTWTINEVLDIFEISPDSVGYDSSILQDPFSPTNIGLALVNPVMSEIMGTPESPLGQLGQAATTMAMNQIISSGGAALPAAIATFFVGNVAGMLLDGSSENRAWATTAYDDQTGDFIITNSWENETIFGIDLGDERIARRIADNYLTLLEGTLSEFKSIHNNYEILGNWQMGYKGRYSQAFHDGFTGRLSDRRSENLLKEALVWDMAQVDLIDGALIFESMLNAMNLRSRFFSENKIELFNDFIYRKTVTSEYLKYLENQEAIDALILEKPNSNFAAGWLATFLAAKEIGITKPINARLTAEGQVFTSSGNDRVFGSMSDDLIRTYSGDDAVIGYGGHDEIFGGAGNDLIRGYSGNDTLDGGTGNDTITGDSGNDTISGGAGHDRLSGGSGKDTFAFHGQPGHDEITDFNLAQGDRVVLHRDALVENKTAYVYDDNNDAIIYINDDTTIRLWGISTAQLDQSSFVYEAPRVVPQINLFGERIFKAQDLPGWTVKFENPHTDSGTIAPQIVTHNGGSRNDVITGSTGHDVIKGRGGTDTIYAGLGDDFIDAGTGDDWNIFGDASSWGVRGNGGADTFFFARGNGVDQIWDFENGVDKIQLDAALRYEDVRVKALGNDTEIKFASGALPGDRIVLKNVSHHDIGADDFVNGIAEEPNGDPQIPAPTHLGTEGDDYITGSHGNNVIHGRGGSDQIYGSAGNDIIDAGPGNDWNVFGDATSWDVRGSGGADTFFFKTGNGIDQIQDFEDGVDKILLENGKGFDDVTIVQNGSITEIKFKDGSSGDRLMLKNTESWKITAEDFAGAAPVTAPPTATPTDGQHLYGDNANDQISGTDGNDRIYGRGGDDRIYAGLGNDFINAGTGNDWNVFGDARSWDDRQSGGADIFYFTDGNKIDQIRDFEDGIDKIQIGNGRDFSDVRVSSWNGITEIRIVGGSSEDRLLLVDVSASQISSEDFV